jgi:large subunit ribosomal protein L14|tara:strand:+ start:179 stop:550 length:372 start_codon:yes stop_codon:yes gene_type:complete
MVQPQTRLRVFDNSGAKIVQCIRTPNKQRSSWGSLILVSVKQLRSKNKIKLKIKKGSVVFAYVLKATLPLKRIGGSRLKASSNGVVLLNKQMQPIASRIFGVVPKELRSSKFLKLITLSGTTI